MLGCRYVRARHRRAHQRLDEPRLFALDEAEYRQFVVAALDDALVAAPGQHRLDMPGAIALPGAIDRAQQFLRQHRRVDLLRRLEAIVAVAAALGRMLAAMAQQHRAATLRSDALRVGHKFDSPCKSWWL